MKMSASRKTGNFLARKKGKSEERRGEGGRWRDMERREREGARGKEGGRREAKPKSIQS